MLGNRRIVMGFIATGMAVTAACGGSKPSSSGGLSHAELIRSGDSICQKTSDQVTPIFAELFPSGNETPPAAKAAPALTQASGIFRTEFTELSSLKPSPSDAKKFTAAMDSMRATVEAGESTAAKANAGDTNGYLQQLQHTNELDEQTRKVMDKLGFKTCGTGS